MEVTEKCSQVCFSFPGLFLLAVPVNVVTLGTQGTQPLAQLCLSKAWSGVSTQKKCPMQGRTMQELVPLSLWGNCGPWELSLCSSQFLALLSAPHFAPPKHMVRALMPAGSRAAIKCSVFSSGGKNRLKKLCLNGVMKISATDPEVLNNPVMQGHS